MPDRRGDAFQRALEEADRKDRALNGSGPAPTGRPRVRGLAFSATPGSAGKARFGLALDWTDEPPDPSAPPPPPPPREPAGRPVDTLAEIATELGFDAALTLSELARRRRDFVWRNHPDRQPVDARERADARVATANALYDRARRELGKGRSRSWSAGAANKRQ
jgi:hypothetical protein